MIARLLEETALRGGEYGCTHAGLVRRRLASETLESRRRRDTKADVSIVS
jgi:hypothetical protein